MTPPLLSLCPAHLPSEDTEGTPQRVCVRPRLGLNLLPAFGVPLQIWHVYSIHTLRVGL